MFGGDCIIPHHAALSCFQTCRREITVCKISKGARCNMQADSSGRERDACCDGSRRFACGPGAAIRQHDGTQPLAEPRRRQSTHARDVDPTAQHVRKPFHCKHLQVFACNTPCAFITVSLHHCCRMTSTKGRRVSPSTLYPGDAHVHDLSSQLSRLRWLVMRRE